MPINTCIPSRISNASGLTVALLLMVACLCGCDRPNSGASNATDTALPGVVAARSTDLPATPQRIVSLAPNVTEILFAAGAGSKVVGVTRFCDFPQKAAALPKVGGVVDPDFEAIAGLKPDLVIGVTSAGDPEITKSLAQAKIPYLYFRMENLDETLGGIHGIAAAAGFDQQGQSMANEMRASVETFAATRNGKRPTVLMLFGRKPLIAAGPNTYADDLLTQAGGENVMKGEVQYPKLDIEKVLELNPDRIIDVSMVEEGADDFWQQYSTLDAVKHKNVYRFTDPAMMRPGPRLVGSFQKLAMAIKGKHGNH